MIRILLAAGGTGGHVFPAVAVAEQLASMGMAPIFVTDRRGKPMIPKAFKATAILAASPYGTTKIMRLKGMAKLAFGALQTLLLHLCYRPKLVIGFGGYPAVAPVLVGKTLNAKAMLHEQNAYFGRANHFLARHVDRIALSWDGTRNIGDDIMAKCDRVGMPVRGAFRQIGAVPYKAPGQGAAIHILIVGGSQGAEVFGTTVPEALSRLPDDMRARLKVTHQVRKNQINDVRAKYNAAGITATLTPFITDMAREMADTHLVVCRSGASSVAELAASGRPSILVPYPDAMDDHQTANANALVDIGGGWLIPEKEMSAGSLAGKISTLVGAPEKLEHAARAAMSLHQEEDAAAIIAQHICQMIGIVPAAPIHARSRS